MIPALNLMSIRARNCNKDPARTCAFASHKAVRSGSSTGT